MKYQSGEEIRKGDKVLWHGDPAEIEFVIEGVTGDPALDWHLRDSGPGVMVRVSTVGPVYEHDTEEEEDLVFVSRATEPRA